MSQPAPGAGLEFLLLWFIQEEHNSYPVTVDRKQLYVEYPAFYILQQRLENWKKGYVNNFNYIEKNDCCSVSPTPATQGVEMSRSVT